VKEVSESESCDTCLVKLVLVNLVLGDLALVDLVLVDLVLVDLGVENYACTREALSESRGNLSNEVFGEIRFAGQS
jgi:hypothetical protein